MQHTPSGTRTLSWRDVAPWIVLGTAAIGLALHVHSYAFVTDDAYISFRYARNWAEGRGVVFNPGDAPVEGYTNFLWVAWLALWMRLGLAPEPVAMASSVLATFALWGGVAWFGRRILPAPQRRWFVVAPLLLALNRSFCVWASGGLETRWFEAFALAGLGQVWLEERAGASGRSPRPWGASRVPTAEQTGRAISCRPGFCPGRCARSWARGLMPTTAPPGGSR